MSTKNKSKKTTIIVILGVLGAVGLLWFGSSSSPAPETVSDPSKLQDMQTGDAPWQPELGGLLGRLKAIGLPGLSMEGAALHIHQHIDIFIHGKAIGIPAGIGISPAVGFSPVHTHDVTGLIHVESPTIQTFTLGQFFDVWGVRLTSSCIGGYCSDANNSLKVFVNGALLGGDPRLSELAAHQEIVVAYGTAGELPSPVPGSYDFPKDE